MSESRISGGSTLYVAKDTMTTITFEGERSVSPPPPPPPTEKKKKPFGAGGPPRRDLSSYILANFGPGSSRVKDQNDFYNDMKNKKNTKTYDPEFIIKLFHDPPPIPNPDIMIPRRKPERCSTCGDYATPYCECVVSNDSCVASAPGHLLKSSPGGALEEHLPDFQPIWLAYGRQLRQSHSFDIDDYPGSSLGAAIMPLRSLMDFNGKGGLLMELANLAIQEYNDKDSNVFKYKALKVEKVNLLVTANVQYFMTVKVSNLTLSTAIETFQIHASLQLRNDKRFIHCCRPKEEVVVGLPTCDVCLGKVRKSDVMEGYFKKKSDVTEGKEA